MALKQPPLPPRPTTSPPPHSAPLLPLPAGVAARELWLRPNPRPFPNLEQARLVRGVVEALIDGSPSGTVKWNVAAESAVKACGFNVELVEEVLEHLLNEGFLTEPLLGTLKRV